MLRSVYGPFRLWSLGPCIGLDLISGSRVCSFNCIYCPFPSRNSKVFPRSESILKELGSLLEILNIHNYTSMTFLLASPGNPLESPYASKLLPYLKSIIDNMGLKSKLMMRIPDLILMKRSFNSLFKYLDFIIVKLDAVSNKLVATINRPKVEIVLDKNLLYRKLRRLRDKVGLIVEVTLMRSPDDPLNMNSSELRLLLELIIDIAPHMVIIQTPYWMNATSGILSVSPRELYSVGSIVADYLSWKRVKVWGAVEDKRHITPIYEDPVAYLFNILARFPLLLIEARDLLREDFLKTLNKLMEMNMVEKVGDVLKVKG